MKLKYSLMTVVLSLIIAGCGSSTGALPSNSSATPAQPTSLFKTYYQAGIRSIKAGHWQDAAAHLVVLSSTNYADSKVLYEYACARNSQASGDNSMASYYLKEIPDNYSGDLSGDILAYKKKFESTSLPAATSKSAQNTQTWHNVITFQGSSIKNTQTFHIQSNNWRINWSTWPGDYGNMNFQIYVYTSDGNPVGVEANVIGRGSDTSYMSGLGVGDYYLTINTGQPYKIVVQEEQ